MEDANIIDNIRDIISSTLKGNPRQTKRFLNTFIIKKSLAQMYYGTDIDMKILAKLLVLQKLNSELFSQLNEWNKGFAICNDEFQKMYESVLTGTSNVDFTQWAVPKIRKWLEREPKELYRYRLDKYFYLTRENLPDNVIDTQKFSNEARLVLGKLSTAMEGTIHDTIEAMTNLNPVDVDNIFVILLPRIENNKLRFFIIKELFMNFVAYQVKILDCIGRSKQTITLADTAQLTIMYKGEEEKVSRLLAKIKGGILSERLYNKIVGYRFFKFLITIQSERLHW